MRNTNELQIQSKCIILLSCSCKHWKVIIFPMEPTGFHLLVANYGVMSIKQADRTSVIFPYAIRSIYWLLIDFVYSQANGKEYSLLLTGRRLYIAVAACQSEGTSQWLCRWYPVFVTFQQIRRKLLDTHRKELPGSHTHSRSIQQTKQAALESRNIVGILFSKLDTTIAKQIPTLHHRTQTTS